MSNYANKPWVSRQNRVYVDGKGGALIATVGCFREASEEIAIARLIAAAPETAAERDRLKEEKVELLVALRLARIALAKAGHHGGVSGVMIEIDNAIAKATAQD